MKRPNPLHPDLMTPAERIADICKILARGLIRLKARQSSRVSDERAESCLHFPPDQSGHATPTHRRDA